jgi:hypothetical protein
VTKELNEARALSEREVLPEQLAAAGWCEVLRRAVGGEARVALEAVGEDRSPRELTVTLRAEGGGTATFGFGKAGAAAVLAPLLRSGALGRSSTPEAVARVLGQQLAHEATRLWGSEVRALGPTARSAGAVRLALTVALGRERFDVSLWLDELGPPPLAETSLVLPLFVAVSSALRAELAELCVGDLWFPESGWLITPDAKNGPALALLGSSAGDGATWVAVQNGSLVLTGPRTTRGALCTATGAHGAPGSAEQAAPSRLPEEWCTASIELGSVRLTTAAAATLRAGARLELERTGARLWIDDRVCAHGDLEEHPEGWALRVREVLAARETGT